MCVENFSSEQKSKGELTKWAEKHIKDPDPEEDNEMRSATADKEKETTTLSREIITVEMYTCGKSLCNDRFPGKGEVEEEQTKEMEKEGRENDQRREGEGQVQGKEAERKNTTEERAADVFEEAIKDRQEKVSRRDECCAQYISMQIESILSSLVKFLKFAS